jgi:GNAT superfamily N-acetyltransferase
MIRRARGDDSRAVAEVHVASWRATYPGLVPDEYLVGLSVERHRESWSKRITQTAMRETVLVVDDPQAGIVGFGSCGPARPGPMGYQGEVYTLYLLPDFQGQGLGRALLLELFRVLGAAECQSTIVWVLATNSSRYFYERLGGQVVGNKTERFAGADLPEVAYGWSDIEAAIRGEKAGGRRT